MASEHRYDPSVIEPKWQESWERERTWEVSNDEVAGALKSYVLEMLPYPSGEPHMGHLKNYSVGDAVAHFHRRTGRRRPGPLPPAPGPPRAAPEGLRRFRPAGGEPPDPPRGASAGLDRQVDR